MLPRRKAPRAPIDPYLYLEKHAEMREQLVADSHMTSLVVAEEEFPVILRFLESICASQTDRYFFFGRMMEVVRSIPGVPMSCSTFARIGDHGCSARIVLRCPEDRSRQVCLQYWVRHHAFAGKTYLIAQFNPTTIVAGGNVAPATIPFGGSPPAWPSSSLAVYGAELRLGYDLLDAMHAQRFKGQRLFSGSAADIRAGRFRVLRAQWASYIPTGDRLGFLQLLPTIYGHTILSGKGTVNLAHHLGLIFDPYPRDGTEERTGIVLQKRHGKKPAWSVVFYDKRARVAQMKQLGTLTEEEIEIISGSVRLDVTAHPPGIISICKAAQDRVRESLSGAWRWATEFVEGSPDATAWWLERAVVALSCEMEDPRPVRRSFATWLVPKALGDVTRLRALANFTRAGFRQLEELDHPLAAAWREIERLEGTTLLAELIARSRLKRAAVYKRRRAWLEEFSIDILVPYGFYRDLLFYAPNSVMGVAERGKIVRAVDRRDGDTSVRLLGLAARRFDEARRSVLRPAMAAKPRALPVFVPPGSLTCSPNEEDENGRVRRAPETSRLFGVVARVSRNPTLRLRATARG
jgi:hypothetical protein